MPWNDNANGPWGQPPSGGGGDKGEPKPGPKRPDRGPKPPPPPGPDFNAGFERLIDELRHRFGGPRGSMQPGVLAAGVLAVVALWAVFGFYRVQVNEQGVVTTFGAYSSTEGPGLHYRLPAPFQAVEMVPVTSLNRLDVGGASGDGATDADAPQESLMLTSDENIIDLKFSVTWRVADASRYLFATRDPEDAVKAVAESAMREVIGRTQLDSILTNGRGQVQLQTADLMQKTLDRWGAGVSIVEVQIRTVSPPQEAVAAFRDVQSAQQDADSAVNEANTYKNKVVNEAKGTAAQIVQSAQGYREQAERTATGDAARFNQIYAEYRHAPQATKDRLYIETMERVLQHSNKVVISGKGVTAPVILPPDVFRPRSGPGAAQPDPTPAPAQPGANP